MKCDKCCGLGTIFERYDDNNFDILACPECSEPLFWKLFFSATLKRQVRITKLHKEWLEVFYFYPTLQVSGKVNRAEFEEAIKEGKEIATENPLEVDLNLLLPVS